MNEAAPSTPAAAPDDPDIARAVQRAKRELERMIDLNPQVMLLVDRAGRITRANRAFLTLAGVADFRIVLGEPVGDFFATQDPEFLAGILARPECAPTDSPASVTGGAAAGIFRFTLVGLGAESESRVLLVEDVTREVTEAAGAEKNHKLSAVRALAGALMHNVNQPLTVISVRAKLMLMALQKGQIKPDEFRKNLEEIGTLSLKIAAILGQVENPKDFVTENYLGDLDIMDLKRSSPN